MGKNSHRARWGLVIAAVVFGVARLTVALLTADSHRYDEPAPTARAGGGGCPGTRVEPAYGRVAWTIRSISEPDRAIPFYPLAAPGGFVVAVGDCIAFVGTGGELRWTIRGAFQAAAVAGHTVVLGGFDGWPRVIGLDVATGQRRWTSGFDVRRGAMVGGDDVVLLAGDSVTALSAADGKRVSEQDGRKGDFRHVLASGGLLIAGGSASDIAGQVVALDGAGRRVTAATVDILVPRPVAADAEVIVVVSDGGVSGAGPARASTEPLTMAAIERTTGRTRWSRPLHALVPPVVAAGGVLAVPLESGLAGVEVSSGQVLWARPDLGRDAHRLDDDTFAVRKGAGPVSAIDARTGGTRWSRAIDRLPLFRMASVDKRGLLLTTLDGRLMMLRASDGTVVWSGAGSPITPSSQRGLESPPLAVAGPVALSLVDDQEAIAITDLP